LTADTHDVSPSVGVPIHSNGIAERGDSKHELAVEDASMLENSRADAASNEEGEVRIKQADM